MRNKYLVAALALVAFSACEAHADNRPLIWDVSRIGDNGLKLRTGLQGSSTMEPTAGVTTEVLADDAGAISSVPLSIWGSILLHSSRSPASLRTTQAAMDYDANAGRARFLLSEKRSWIETAAMDVVSRRTVALSAGAEGKAGIAASQTFRLEFPDLGAAFATTGVADSGARTFTKAISIEKKLTRRATVTASLTETDRQPTASLRFDYSVKW
ncbi:hypothetical protein [Rhizobium sp. C4]|uniref:hypothetical protein n=1 Tax=Rhizobium sp. C4 TaxID=1349800 RepID=UPI001E42F1D6|nr:hypothetical protein [Rhizobium sp. C4]MCD2171751.1 hypothetical protein [Rhizobium sp. C4]